MVNQLYLTLKQITVRSLFFIFKAGFDPLSANE